MNHLKTIFKSLADIGILPPSSAIRRSWGIVRAALDAHEPMVAPIAVEQYALAVKLIDRIISAVAGVADDAEKSAVKKGQAAS